jgi:dinuclear metal center YbgI/SA1388 family protein
MSRRENGALSGGVELSELVSYLDQFLEAGEFEDYGPNGLQVEGSRQVSKIVTGVSACIELFERARDAQAQAILVHHGLFWNGLSPVLTGSLRRRIGVLIEAEMSLLGYHLPLDAHQTLGNNVLAAEGLGLAEITPFGMAKGRLVGYRGVFAEALHTLTLADRCRDLFGQEPLLLGSRDALVRTVAVVSGGAQSLLHEAIAAGVDAFITGEASEWVTNLSRESGICYVAAGHHATERLGIKALGKHLAQQFGLDSEFIDIPNPV